MSTLLQDCPLNCGRRHKEGHPHLEAREPSTPSNGISVVEDSQAPNAGASSGVAGASSPESLAAQAAQAISSERKQPKPIKTKEQKEAEEKVARITAMVPLARKLSVAPYTAISILMMDERWRKFAEDELRALEQATLNVMLAYGIDFSGKFSSLMALAITHAEIASVKFRYIYLEEARKKAAAKATQEQPKPEGSNVN